MKAKFSGGSLDGQERVGDGFGYRYVAPIYEPETGTAEEMRWIDMDEVWGNKPRKQAKLVVETYVRDRDNYQRDNAGEVTAIAFKLESTEPYRKGT